MFLLQKKIRDFSFSFSAPFRIYSDYLAGEKIKRQPNAKHFTATIVASLALQFKRRKQPVIWKMKNDKKKFGSYHQSLK